MFQLDKGHEMMNCRQKIGNGIVCLPNCDNSSRSNESRVTYYKQMVLMKYQMNQVQHQKV